MHYSILLLFPSLLFLLLFPFPPLFPPFPPLLCVLPMVPPRVAEANELRRKVFPSLFFLMRSTCASMLCVSPNNACFNDSQRVPFVRALVATCFAWRKTNMYAVSYVRSSTRKCRLKREKVPDMVDKQYEDSINKSFTVTVKFLCTYHLQQRSRTFRGVTFHQSPPLHGHAYRGRHP